MLFVTSELAKILQTSLIGINKENVILQRPDSLITQSTATFPLIAVYDSGFQFEEVGFGAGVGTNREERREEFSGDGKKNIFILQEEPVRPIISVESPEGNYKKAVDDYRVHYPRRMLIFRTAPNKGKNNLLVRYSVIKSATEIDGLKLKIKCCIDLWSNNSDQCDSIMIDVMKAILTSKLSLTAKGIYITPLRGRRILEDYDYKISTENKAKEMLFGRRLLYLAEATIKVEIKTPRIEKIEIAGKK